MLEDVSADVVVVGGGSAGCVVAARLSEDPRCRVVLLEAGARDRLGLTKLPSALLRLAGRSAFDWGYESAPDPGRHGRTEHWPRGRTLGGSSAINGAIFIRGAPADYDAWTALGNPGWSWRDVLPLFRRLEDAEAGPDNAWRGSLGPQRVSGLRWVHSLTPKVIAAAEALGLPFSPDLNGDQHEGIGYCQGSTRDGRRLSAYEAFLEPHLNRPNLRVLDQALVERVVLEDQRATGVVVRRGGQRLLVQARGVVLAAGAINSPQVLMLSGIGDPDTLRNHGITPLVARPEIGRNLMEHPGFNLHVEVDQPTGNTAQLPWNAPVHLLRYLMARRGPICSPTTQALAFFRSRPWEPEPDMQLQLFPYGGEIDGSRRRILLRDLLTLLLNVNHPLSRGWIALQGADPALAPEIHPRLLDHPADVACLRRGLAWARRLVATPPFASHVLELVNVPPEGADEATETDWLRGVVRPFLHPAGTCRMGPDPHAVVTPELEVRGTRGLWVADASIFPRHIAANINATVLMIGEKAAGLVAERMQAERQERTLLPELA